MDQTQKIENKSKIRKGTAIFATTYEYDESYQRQ